MKIHALIQADGGVPFYKVKVGDYFQYVHTFNGVVSRSSNLFEHYQVFKKVDQVGAIDYPYDRMSEENTMFIGEKALVKVVRKTSKSYKNYVKEVEQLLEQVNQVVRFIEPDER